MANRKPDYLVGALSKTRNVRQPKVGAAWANPDGTISLTLDPFVQLQGGTELLVTLFPNKDKQPTKDGEQKPVALRPSQLGYDEEEVPF